MRRGHLLLAAAIMESPVLASGEPERSEESLIEEVPLTTVTPLFLEPGDELILEGSVYCSHDGSRFLPADWYNLAAGGLRLVAREGDRARIVVERADDEACSIARRPSPCLVPRVIDLALARLLSVGELRAKSVGGFHALVPLPKQSTANPPPSVSGGPVLGKDALGWPVLRAITAIGASATVALLLLLVRARQRQPLARVLLAARVARRTVGRDPTLCELTSLVDTLVDQAHQIDNARRQCAARRKCLVRTCTFPGDCADEWAQRETAEHARLLADQTVGMAELERIATALRVIVLQARRSSPVATQILAKVNAELELRDQGLAEAERLLEA
ncbi:MAG: hypothetical protein V2A73_18430 [Pseudomonadota bacterium]